MEHPLLFAEAVKPSPELERLIERELRVADVGRIRRRALLLVGLLAVSAVLVVPVAAWLRQGLGEGGFFSYISLLFSDWSATLASSKEFALTLLESLPVASLAVMLGLFCLLIAGIRSAARLIHFARGRGVGVIN